MRFRMNIASAVAACLFAVALLVCLPSGDATVVGFYNFDEGSGTTVGDTSGSGFDGVLAGGGSAPTWVSDGGASGDTGDHSMDFVETASVTGYVDLVDPTRMQLTGSRTISFWLKSDPMVGARQAIYEKAYNHEGTLLFYPDGHFLLVNGDEPNPANINNTSEYFVRSTGPVVANNVWHHIVDTRDSANQTSQFYINGVGQGNVAWTARNPLTASNAAWKLGTGYEGTFGGELDDFAFIDRELTPGEIASMYQLDFQADNALRALGMNVPELDELWDIYAGGLGNSGTVDGKTWTHVDGISAGGHVLGEAWSVSALPGSGQTGSQTFLLLDTGTNSGLLLSEVVPEPSSFLLLGLGVLGLVRNMRRRRRQA